MTKRAASWAIVLGTCWCWSLGGAPVVQAQAAAQAAPAGAEAQPAPQGAEAEEMARQHFSLGRAQYQSGAFREAAASFAQAYALSKREVLWYNIYLAHRDAGNNEQAAIALRNYLERVPELENRGQLEARLESLDRIVAEEEQREREAAERAAAEQQQAAAAEQAPTTAAPIADVEHDTTVKPEASRSIVPYVLMGMGGAMVIGGVVTGAMSSSKYSELEEKCPELPCDKSLESIADEGKTLALTADLLLFGGIAAAVTGGVWWLLDTPGAGSEEQPVRAALSCGPGACNGSVALRF